MFGFGVIFENVSMILSCEFSSVDKDITLYMQESEFEPQTLYLFIFKVEFLTTKSL
jgi:hypothetical protein